VEETKQNQRISRNLKNLYLDPNNYRFVDHKDYKFVDNTEDILDAKIQQRTRNFISGKNRGDIKDLLDSFRANGFLDVDVIQLEDLGDNNYRVLEGNRRVTALKALKDDYDAGVDIGKLDPNIFKSVPSVIHSNEDEKTHQIIMGLKHISGNKKWPAINQAQLIYDYLKEFWGSDEYYAQEIVLCESLGITKVKLRNSQRAYHLILQYKESDYGDQFNSDMYYTFAEITKRPNIKKWIDWDDNTYQAKNDENILRLFGWLSQREESDELDEEEIEDAKKIEPIISKYREIQDLAKFIDNEEALEAMEESGSVAEGLVASGSKEQESYQKSLKDIEEHIDNLDRLSDLLTYEDMEKLKKLNQQFTNILPNDASLEIHNEEFTLAFGRSKVSHFESLSIQQYKIFKDFTIDKLNRINIFAGFNNTGKTTLLEAIYILTKQNNIGAFFELIKLRHKLDKLDSKMLSAYFQDDIEISGVFNNHNTKVTVEKLKSVTIDKKDDHIASYEVKAFIGEDSNNNIIHTFQVNPLQRYYDKIEILCSSLFKSPYLYNRQEVINTHYKNVELKVFDMVVEFIQKHIDSNINDIDFTDGDNIKRFLIDSQSFPEKSIAITNYGEGLQRIFEIALSFAYCKNGAVLIDELETAIHYSLLVDFTHFIQELAEKFNVQVFITSHSKECIDAFVNNEYRNDEISAYFLKYRENNLKAVHTTGDKLKKYIDDMNFDLRGK